MNPDNTKAPRYLEDIPREEALERWFDALRGTGNLDPFPGEPVTLEQALGRTSAESVWAALSSPHYHASAMDGYAVKAADTEGATETSPLSLKTGPEGPALRIDTGDPLPSWADSVIMIEAVQHKDDNSIEIRSGVAPWSHVRSMGEDMVATELVLPKNKKLSAVDLGAAAGSGHAEIQVRRKPKVAVIPTGTELVELSGSSEPRPGPGDIIEYNSLILSSLISEWGGDPVRYSPVRDDIDSLAAVLTEAAGVSDCIVVIAGSSAGTEDYSETVIRKLGTVIVHGVAVKPGHPVILGTISREVRAGGDGSPDSAGQKTVPVLGAPGYPVSCTLSAENFLKPLLSKWLGLPTRKRPTADAVFSKKIFSDPGLEEFVRVTLGRVGEKTIAAPLARGAGVITSLVRADGMVRIPRLSEGIAAGETVSVELFRAGTEIDNTILHIGSHDICLDMLAEQLADYSRRFASSNAGSLGGLIALKRGEAHLAGSHLLDPESGEYNRLYIQKYLPETAVARLGFVLREQGLILPPGNPKGIRKLEDLGSGDFTFVNRQRGAGTRVLLDYRLGQLGIDPESIPGYGREEYTHLAVAAAVQSGRADCGIGIAAAAHVLGLDFVPLEQERYELIIPMTFFHSQLLQPLLELLNKKSFRQAVETLPGYDASIMGELAETGAG